MHFRYKDVFYFTRARKRILDVCFNLKFEFGLFVFNSMFKPILLHNINIYMK